MTMMAPIHSSHDFEEEDPKYHTNDECPYYRELAHKGWLAVGTGGHPLCEWCVEHTPR
ncbi:MAG TPA: hypothetical protein VED59_09330 [Acidimicrobiales bacterium]|nr:hypothetical protein [Acidimicrobiales bacterium]